MKKIKYPKGYIPQRCGVYTRMSEILPGTEDIFAGVGRQEEDSRKLGAFKNWGIGKVYQDNNVSAYKKHIVREDWQQLLSDLRDGTIDGLIAYDLDRVARQPRDLEDLIDIIESTNAPNTVVTGEVDLSTDNGKMVARILVSIANKSSADTARRVSRQKEQRADQAKPPVGRFRTYGYLKDFSNFIPEEAELLREARRRVLAGETLHALVKEFNAAGRLPYSGKPWRTQNLSNMLKNPSHAGLRAFKKEVRSEGKWPKIFTIDEHEEIVAHLKGNEPYSRNTARKHLLVGILICDLCGASLGVNSGKYICNSNRGGCGKIVRDQKTVDDFFIKLTYKAIKALPAVVEFEDEEDDESKAEIERLRAKIKEAFDLWKDDSSPIGASEYVDIKSDAEAKIKALQKTSARQAKLPVDDAESFFNAGTDKQRATIKRLFNIVAVKPTGAKGTRFDPKQLDFNR